mmetsp:Transcript_39905/g.98068  ORF Transcript_39905/g.98068 Transcript_39905/m.98068 type:complete len:266 (-) Transcript_39905:921-1718(-)
MIGLHAHSRTHMHTPESRAALGLWHGCGGGHVAGPRDFDHVLPLVGSLLPVRLHLGVVEQACIKQALNRRLVHLDPDENDLLAPITPLRCWVVGLCEIHGNLADLPALLLPLVRPVGQRCGCPPKAKRAELKVVARVRPVLGTPVLVGDPNEALGADDGAHRSALSNINLVVLGCASGELPCVHKLPRLRVDLDREVHDHLHQPLRVERPPARVNKRCDPKARSSRGRCALLLVRVTHTAVLPPPVLVHVLVRVAVAVPVRGLAV